MKNSFVLPIAMAAQLTSGAAWAQGPGRHVEIVRMGGPRLGVMIEEVDKDGVARLKLKEEKGALVTEVLKNSAAEKAGIRRDDVIVAFQGQSVLTAAQLRRLVREVPAGRTVDLDLVRAGSPTRVAVTLERGDWSSRDTDMPDPEDLSEKLRDFGDFRFRSHDGAPHAFDFKLDEGSPAMMALAWGGRGRLGITYTEIDGQLARYFKAPKDVAILVNSVVEGSAAEKAGIKAGDLLLKLGTTTVEDASDLRGAVRELEPGEASQVTVLREGKSVELSVTVSEEGTRGPDPLRRRRPVS